MWTMDKDQVIGGTLLLLIHELEVLGRQHDLWREALRELRRVQNAQAWRRWRGSLRRQLSQRRAEERQIRRELWTGLRRDLFGR